MSLTKRVLFGKDPALDQIRRRIGEENWAYVDKFPFRVPMRRRNKGAGTPQWDRHWPISLERAVEELKLEVVRVNEGMFFRSEHQRDAAVRLAESSWNRSARRN
jgi:hypothetical protein